jgi:hypothetical protein
MMEISFKEKDFFKFNMIMKEKKTILKSKYITYP